MGSRNLVREKNLEVSPYRERPVLGDIVLTVQQVPLQIEKYDLFMYHNLTEATATRTAALVQRGMAKKEYRDGVSLQEADMLFNAIASEDDFNLIEGFASHHISRLYRKLKAEGKKSEYEELHRKVVERQTQFEPLRGKFWSK